MVTSSGIVHAQDYSSKTIQWCYINSGTSLLTRGFTLVEILKKFNFQGMQFNSQWHLLNTGLVNMKCNPCIYDCFEICNTFLCFPSSGVRSECYICLHIVVLDFIDCEMKLKECSHTPFTAHVIEWSFTKGCLTQCCYVDTKIYCHKGLAQEEECWATESLCLGLNVSETDT